MAIYKVKIGGKEYSVEVIDGWSGEATVTVDGETFDVAPLDPAAPPASPPTAAQPTQPTSQTTPAATPPATSTPKARPSGGSGEIAAPIPGVITELCVGTGDTVVSGQVVLKLEAMKMENDIASPVDGTVKEIPVAVGAEVTDGQLLMVIA
jgi:biotin carboxyl carrier protein